MGVSLGTVASESSAKMGGLEPGVTRTANATGTPVTSVSTSMGTLGDGGLVNTGRNAATAYVLILEPIGTDASTPAS